MQLRIRDFLIVIAIYFVFAAIGYSEQLPESSQKQLDLARAGVPETELATR